MAAFFSLRVINKLKLPYTKFKFSLSDNGNPLLNSHSKLSTNKINSFEYCVNSVRKHDHENYLCTLLLPGSARSPVFVIRAFNVELALVRDQVSSPAIGYMRIQFWKDILEQIYRGQPPAQPIAAELAKAVATHKLSKLWFNHLINCREDIMSDKGFLTILELENYCEQSVASVYYLTLQAMGLQDVHCDHVASHLGKCQGICNLIRGIPFNASRGRVYIPMELMSKHNLSQEGVLHGEQKELTEVVFELASIAHQHLELLSQAEWLRQLHRSGVLFLPWKGKLLTLLLRALGAAEVWSFSDLALKITCNVLCLFQKTTENARSFGKKIPKHAWPAFLPAVASDAFLKSLQKSGFNILNPKHQFRNNWLPISLLFHKIRKQY